MHSITGRNQAKDRPRESKSMRARVHVRVCARLAHVVDLADEGLHDELDLGHQESRVLGVLLRLLVGGARHGAVCRAGRWPVSHTTSVGRSLGRNGNGIAHMQQAGQKAKKRGAGSALSDELTD